jgi:hypothetical protein
MFISKNDNSLHSWKANYDEVPRFASDDWFLKLKITDAAAKYNLIGDINTDQGYSFSY